MHHPTIHLTIYISLICYAIALVCWVSRRRGAHYRVFWTVACVSMWSHAIAAFHYYHNWSHQHAVELTAQRTLEVTGQPYGEGIWFSYALLVVWALDAALGWNPKVRNASWYPWLSTIIHLYAFFILFNGTVIFESGLVRWGGVVGTIWALRMAWRFRSAPLVWE